MPRKSSPARSGDPLWIKDVQSGRDHITGKWRMAGGATLPKNEVLAQFRNELVSLGGVVGKYPELPFTKASEELEHIVAGGIHPLDAAHPRKEGADPHPIPGNVLATYRLAEYYYEAEGDIAA